MGTFTATEIRKGANRGIELVSLFNVGRGVICSRYLGSRSIPSALSLKFIK